MKPYLVFFDDDSEELRELGSIVSEEYDYCPIKWPAQEPIQLDRMPSIIVLDLYFPIADSTAVSIPPDQVENQKHLAAAVATGFGALYDAEIDGPTQLKRTFACIQQGYDLLWRQCDALGQSPANGRDLLARLLADPEFDEIPIVFYSRKATVEEAVRALQAGAFSVIPKAPSPPDRRAREAVLAQLDLARERFAAVAPYRKSLRKRLGFPINVNITLFKQEVVAQKLEFTLGSVAIG